MGYNPACFRIIYFDQPSQIIGESIDASYQPEQRGDGTEKTDERRRHCSERIDEATVS